MKQKSADYPSTVKKRSTGGLEPKGSEAAGSLGSRGELKGTGGSTDGNLGSSTKKAAEELVTRTRAATDDDKYLSDKFSGLRIINPVISSVVMEKRMEGRKMVKISQIPTKIKGNNDIDGDWVTIGVVVQKLPPKKSSNVRIINL